MYNFLHACGALDTFLQRSTKIHSVCFIKKDKNDMNINMTKTKMLADVRNLIEPSLKVFILYFIC